VPSVESIKRIRKARGLSLTQVGERSGISRTAIARAEQAGYDPRASTLEAIAKALGVHVCELFGDKGHERIRPQRKPKQ